MRYDDQREENACLSSSEFVEVNDDIHDVKMENTFHRKPRQTDKGVNSEPNQLEKDLESTSLKSGCRYSKPQNTAGGDPERRKLNICAMSSDEISEFFKKKAIVNYEMNFIWGDSPYGFWLCNTSNRELQIHLADLQKQIESGELLEMKGAPNSGEFIIGFLGSLFRGVVLCTQADTIYVMDVDNGTLKMVKTGTFWNNDNSLFFIPPQAVYCRLHSIPHRVDWNSALRLQFIKSMTISNPIICIQNIIPGLIPTFVVDLRVDNRFYKFNLSEWVNSHVVSTLNGLQSFQFPYNVLEDILTAIDPLFIYKKVLLDSDSTISEHFLQDVTYCSGSSDVSIDQHCDSPSRPVLDEQDDYKEIHESGSVSVYKENPFTSIPWQLRKNTIIQVSYLHGTHPWDFYLHIVPEKEIMQLKQEIVRYSELGLLKKLCLKPEIGDFVIAEYHIYFLRCRIIDIHSLVSGTKYVVIDVDNGKQNVFEFDDLWMMEDAFLKPPAMAIRCCIYNLKSPPSYWNLELENMFCSMIRNSKLNIIVKDIECYDKDAIHFVKIKNCSNSKLDVEEWLNNHVFPKFALIRQSMFDRKPDDIIKLLDPTRIFK